MTGCRWTNAIVDSKPVRQLTYQVCDVEVNVDAVRARKTQRTHEERYRQAVQATHHIASELADITDETEFHEMLDFLLDQWRNIRQGKRTTIDAETTTNVVPVQASCQDPTGVVNIPSQVTPQAQDVGFFPQASRQGPTGVVNFPSQVTPQAQDVVFFH